MGCGVSQAVLRGDDDVSKSDAFIQLCAGEKNPIAVQLNSYFNALISECMYKSQGDMGGYERLLAKRPTEITVNRSKLAAQRHGIGHKPLTVDGVNDIMNLFLGHAIKSLEKRKWSGTFNYALMQPLPEMETADSGYGITDSSAAASRAGSRADSAAPSKGKKGNPFSDVSASRQKQRKEGVEAASVTAAHSGEEAAAAAATPPSPPADASAVNGSGTQRQKRAAFTVPASVAGNGNTLMFVDHGKGRSKDDDPNRQWKMELTGNITFPSIDGALTLICDCKVDFLFFTCDGHLPMVADSVAPGENTATPSQEHAPPKSSTVEYPSDNVEYLNSKAQPASSKKSEKRGVVSSS